jgi:type II secretory pathway component PulF
MRFSSKNLSAFYFQLGTLVQAGLPIQSALASARKTAPRPMRPTVSALSTLVDQGTPLSEAMEQCGRSFAPLDRHSIHMTERSGALDVGLLSLSKYYETRAAARNKLIAGSLYPAFVFTAGVFIPPLPGLIVGKTTVAGYLIHTAGLLVGLVVIAWLISLLARWLFTVPGLNLVIDRLLIAVPVFGRLRFDYALSQWVSSIRLMLAAGIGVVDALKSASAMAFSPLIVDAYKRASPQISSGLEVSQALASTGVFPDDLIQYWTTGEKSGRMDEMLERLAVFYEERWRRSLDHVVTWLPRIAYGFVATYMIWQIFTLATAYFNTYNQFLGD